MAPRHTSHLSGMESGQVTYNGQPLRGYLPSFEESFALRVEAGEVMRVVDLMMPEIDYTADEMPLLPDPYTGTYPADAPSPTLY